MLAEQVQAVRQGATDRPLFVLDLGMPSDVEAAVGELPHGRAPASTTVAR